MVKVEKIDGSKVALEIEVEQPVVEDALNQAYKKVVKQVSLPGFRKGKVPRPILESRFGPEVLYEEALEIMVPDAYDNAVEEAGIEPIDRPEIDLVQMEKGKPFIFKATVEVKPEVELGEYRGVEVTRELKEITEDDVEKKLDAMRHEHVKMHVVDGAVEQGDLAVIDFTGYKDGEPFEGGSAEGHSLEVGSGSFIPGFEEQVVGMKAGEEKDIDVTFPEDYHSEDLAGKPVTFKVKVQEVKRKEYPELNDDFAAEVSEFGTLAELKEDVLNKLKEEEENRAKTVVEEKVVQAVAANSEAPVPDPMVEREIDRMTGEMEQFLRMQGLTLEKFTSLTGKTMEDLREEKREEAGQRVKANLVLDAIIEKEGIEATDEEVEERIEKFAESYGQPVETIKEYFEAQGQSNVLRQEIKFRKAVDFLMEEAKITDVAASEPKQEE
ncbi:trigger factor [Dethiobacter alkaliphilus]|uniref:Trigger factor n=1 Tax=Dethiobacter alkaliphilus AHT 1 TaxID=555088 RepID=C0GEZ3_DETAL|nr:trigger factor [Dethiobacter alkaliphilus]EEG78175.1 trigger factor [Dethiobacter alkaliphilus AHT 1]